MRKRTAVIAAVAVVAVGGGVAYAAWSSTGADNGTVGSMTSVSSTISPIDGSGGLFPGRLVNFSVTPRSSSTAAPPVPSPASP